MTLLHEDRLFPGEQGTRAIARRLYERVRGLPIISPHGHTQAEWFARNQPFPDPVALFVQPDHYVFRMLYSQGITLDELEIGSKRIADPRKVWKIFADHYHLFRATPTRLWLDFAFQELFGFTERLSAATANHYYDVIEAKLATAEFLPRALYDRFGIEVLARRIRLWIRWHTTRQFGIRDGRGELCLRSGPTRWSILRSMVLLWACALLVR